MNGNFQRILTLVFLLILLIPLYNVTEYDPGIRVLICSSFIFVSIIMYKDYKKDYRTKINSIYIPDYFNEMYQEVYNNNNIYLLEAMRKKARNTIIIVLIGVLITFIGMINSNLLVMLIGLIVILVGSNKKAEKSYKLMYKKEILSEFIKLINEKLEYKNENINSEKIQKTYEYANFDNKSFNIFKADDYIEGILEENIYAKMSDLLIQRKEVYYEKGKRRERIIEIFQGMFVETESSTNIGTHIKISKNKLKIFGQNNRVEMDSQEFEKYFDIYSENKILAMQLLTSDIMNTLIDFYTRYNMEYEIVIRDNKIYMRFFTGAMFEPKIFGNSMDKRLLFSYFCILKFIVNVTKEVNKALKEVEI